VTQHTEISLEGCYQRIARGREQLDDLCQDVREFLESDPCEISLSQHVQRPFDFLGLQTAEDQLKFKILKTPPLKWAMRIGEVGYNLRAALDHLVFQLAVWNNSNPEDKRTQFPIIIEPAQYFGGRNWRKVMLKGVSQQHQAMIDLLQPYQVGKTAEGTALASLNWFSSKDKHQVHHPPVFVIHGFKLMVTGNRLVGSEIYLPYTGKPQISTKEDEDHSMSLSINSRGDTDVKETEIKVGIGFGDRLLQLGDFYWITDRVERIIQKFGPTVGC